jgi:hypothetical protein
MNVWALRSKRELPRKRGPQFWTGQDYTPEIEKALRFGSQQEADKWLQAHRHLRPLLEVVFVTAAEPT